MHTIVTPLYYDRHDLTILVTLDICEYANSRFIIDTGAMSSILKYHIIKKGTRVLRDNSKFYGLIKDHSVSAVGRVDASITLNNSVSIPHSFYIVYDKINLPHDGILGADFLKLYNARINYPKQYLKLQIEADVILPSNKLSIETSSSARESTMESLNENKLKSTPSLSNEQAKNGKPSFVDELTEEPPSVDEGGGHVPSTDELTEEPTLANELAERMSSSKELTKGPSPLEELTESMSSPHELTGNKPLGNKSAESTSPFNELAEKVDVFNECFLNPPNEKVGLEKFTVEFEFLDNKSEPVIGTALTGTIQEELVNRDAVELIDLMNGCIHVKEQCAPDILQETPIDEFQPAKQSAGSKKKKKSKPSKRVVNKHFYRDLHPSFFEKFPKIQLEKRKFYKEEHIGLQELVPMYELEEFKKAQTFLPCLQAYAAVDSRLQYLKENIDFCHCSPNELEQLFLIFKPFAGIFQLPGDSFRHTDVDEHQIILKPHTPPVNQRQFRIPEAHRSEIQRQLDELETNGIIARCDSPWNSPIFLVPKKPNERGEKQFRLVIDYRELNKVIEPTSFPLPLIDEIIDQMNGCKYFTTLDLFGAYHQIRLEENSRQYTAFSTSWEKYCFNSIPFGLVSSPYAWLKVIHKVLKGLIGLGVLVYMDDIIIYSPTLTEHFEILTQVFQRFSDHFLKLKVDKSKFLSDRVAYLGFIISTKGLHTDPKKVECIKHFPRPISVKHTQSFLGLCNYYRRYIENYAGIARPLYNLCKKENEFVWTSECEDSFEKFKELLSNPPILIFPNFAEIFILRTDCSMIAAAGVLSQGEIPDDRPIQYFSKVLNPAQTRYSTIEQELLAIILSVEHFHYYLLGREFLIVTDHRPLAYLFNTKNMSARLHRWRYVLMSYQFKIVYKSGKSNVVADALSRIQINPDETGESEFNRMDVDMLKFNKIPMHIQTRAQAEKARPAKRPAQQDVPKDYKHDPPDKPVRKLFIHELREMTTSLKNFDHLFYLIRDKNDELFRKLQHKIKKQIDLTDVKPNELFL